MATNKKAEVKPTIDDYWWLKKTCNPNDTKNETITVISNIYCLCDFTGIQIEDFEEAINIKPGSLRKILDDTEKEWNDNSTPIDKKDLPIINPSVVEKTSKYFKVSEETLRETAFSPNFYYYTFGQPTSLNVKEANEQNMKLILFIEKITLDCRNYAFNIIEFAKGDENHFEAFYTIEYSGNPSYKFKINKDKKGSIIIMIGSNSMMDKLIFQNNDIVYPMAFRMEEVLHESAERDHQFNKVTNIPTNVFNIMDSFLSGDPVRQEEAPEPSKGWRMPEGFNKTTKPTKVEFPQSKAVQQLNEKLVETVNTEYEDTVISANEDKENKDEAEEPVVEKQTMEEDGQKQPHSVG